jgi:hypothetical protein
MSNEPSQVVERPEPGLARGRWEAPAWVFYAVVLATVAAGIVWAVRAVRALRTARAGRGQR